ncbi:AglZ/HisF2 family acetamidino modification protein [Flavobacterium sp. LHD-80]|uniref:AglZ/HisF2 family acetamidino modification protein n=1 Tax=Flavobacterium sp. LHD-80 TaxID=3071411 RepID=UPI0027E0BBF6|nr:AglZ/HisF2 family acetamidino modification protein [Flavobacterium sp. LHD-80]MDQ6472059.1 AglZ/HisF2 family acetamidino modification protein [Flavobacterium sp. LHD-80]
MLRTRIIPILLLNDGGLVKTVKFSKDRYIGDPINAVKIFNKKEVDELVLLDIGASRNGTSPNFMEIKEIVSEAFMPVGYGGGISKMEHIEQLFNIGVEKVILNSVIFENKELIEEAIKIYGSQSIVASIDVKKDIWGNYKIFSNSGKKKQNISLDSCIKLIQEIGFGELVINNIDKDGTMQGYDLDLVGKVTAMLDIPVVSAGGAGTINDFIKAIKAGASAVAAGSMFVFQGVHRAVLISYITADQLEQELKE